jgi:membrane associated rhomboid family serine protease
MSATISILIVIFLIFSLQQFLPLEEYFSLIPEKSLKEPWRFFTSIFLHADFFHLFFNSWALFVFGIELERRVGPKEFIEIFFTSGIFASLFYFSLAYFIDPKTPALGASGAIYGIIGSLALIAPSLYVIVYFIPIPLFLFAIIYAFIEFIGTIMFIFGVKSSIAYAAHLAGIIVGFLFGKKLRFKKRK